MQLVSSCLTQDVGQAVRSRVRGSGVPDTSEMMPEPTAAASVSKYARLSRSDVAMIWKLHLDGLPQTTIAQRLGCCQQTVSAWLAQLTDTTDAAKQYLRGQSLRMAQNIVKRGKPRDHVNVLQGIEVLRQPQGSQLVVIVGGSDSITLSSETEPIDITPTE